MVDFGATTLGGARLWLAGGAALLAAFTLWHFAALRVRIGTRSALLLASLRAGAVLAVLVLAAGPRIVRRALSPPLRPLALAIDASRSMALRGGLPDTRLARVQAFLASEPFRELAAGYLPRAAGFAASSTPIGPGGASQLRPEGERTDLARALREGAAGSPAALVVFTDGGHQTGGPSDPGGLSDVPLVLVGVGAGERRLDTEVASADPPALAFAGQPAQIAVVVRAAGAAGQSVPLLLRRGEQVLVSRTIELPADGEQLRTTLEWTPPAPGTYALSVQLPEREGEEVVANNRAELTLSAARDKIRVLLVTGAPSWSYRFLRGALKGDPSLDVVSFIILRTASDAVDVPQQELSLIPFPTQRIFLDELQNFDLLVFDNFAYQPYLPPQYLERIEAYVARGGAFWMLGGPLSFVGGRYAGTPIAELLPVGLPDLPLGQSAFVDEVFQPRLTAAGARHPFFAAVAGRAGGPPPLRGCNLAGPPRPGAVVLAEAPLPSGTTQPLAVLGRHGRGRVLALLTDSLWSWAFAEAARGSGNLAYLTFVRQAVRWSVGDPQLEPLRVDAERATVTPGEPLRARIRVLGEDFLPAADPALSVSLRGPDGARRALVPALEAPGIYRVEAQTTGEGSWTIDAQASARGAVYARAEATIAAAWPPEEYRSPGLNRDALTALMSGRRAAFVELGSPDATAAALARALAELAPSGRAQRDESSELAELLWAFAALLALLAAEWVARRRVGLD